MLLDLVRQLGAHDVLEAGVVLDVGGVPQLAAGDPALENKRGNARTAGIKGGRLTRGSGPDDDDLVVVRFVRHGLSQYFTF